MGVVPTLRGTIDRRILVNFRIDPASLDSVLPDRFRPRTVDTSGGSYAIGGICCIRLANMRPAAVPIPVGVGSENAAHRIGVEWDQSGSVTAGVYVPRRDTSSRLNSLVGSRSFGRHYHASFDVSESGDRYSLSMEHADHNVRVAVSATKTTELPKSSVFDDVSAASSYHKCGAIGYCPTEEGDQLKGVELATDDWHVTPLSVDHVEASFFESNLPADAVSFDNALLMEGIDHEWQPRSAMALE